MPVLFQLCQTSSFALFSGPRYRHVAFGLRGTWNCAIFSGEYSKGYPGQPKSQGEWIRRLMNAPSASRLRPAVAGVRRVKRLWLSFVDPPLSRLRRTDFVEYLFFISDVVWQCGYS